MPAIATTALSRSLPLLLCALLLALPGHGQGASDDEDPTAQLSKLQSLLFAYADNYMSAIAQATQEVREKDPTNPDLRLRMHGLKLLVTASVQQLAVSSNPESTLLDMMVFATLHRMVFDGDWARERYGEGSERILLALRVLEKEIWDTASGYPGLSSGRSRKFSTRWRSSPRSGRRSRKPRA